MPLSMHSASVPLFTRTLKNLDRWLDKAAAHAQARKFDAKVLLEARLYPDMLPFTKQVQIACDTAKFAVMRLSGADAPKFDDNEASIDELKARIAKTLEFLTSVPATAFDGSEERAVSVPIRNAEPLQFTGLTYLQFHALPNFYFHATTAYALLRHNGVELGKPDFLGPRL